MDAHRISVLHGHVVLACNVYCAGSQRWAGALADEYGEYVAAGLVGVVVVVGWGALGLVVPVVHAAGPVLHQRVHPTLLVLEGSAGICLDLGGEVLDVPVD